MSFSKAGNAFEVPCKGSIGVDKRRGSHSACLHPSDTK